MSMMLRISGMDYISGNILYLHINTSSWVPNLCQLFFEINLQSNVNFAFISSSVIFNIIILPLSCFHLVVCQSKIYSLSGKEGSISSSIVKVSPGLK